MYFVTEHEEIARQILHLRRKQCKSNYPFAQTSVYLTRMLSDLVNLMKPVENTHRVILYPERWLSWCSDSTTEDTCTLDVGVSHRIWASHLWR